MQDGLHVAQFGRLIAARHEAFYDGACGGSADHPDPLACEKEITLSWRCSLHVDSSAIHWQMNRLVTLPDLLDKVHIVIKSLNNSTMALNRVARPFVEMYVDFSRTQETQNEAEVCWRLLGVRENLLPDIARVNPL